TRLREITRLRMRCANSEMRRVKVTSCASTTGAGKLTSTSRVGLIGKPERAHPAKRYRKAPSRSSSNCHRPSALAGRYGAWATRLPHLLGGVRCGRAIAPSPGRRAIAPSPWEGLGAGARLPLPMGGVGEGAQHEEPIPESSYSLSLWERAGERVRSMRVRLAPARQPGSAARCAERLCLSITQQILPEATPHAREA